MRNQRMGVGAALLALIVVGLAVTRLTHHPADANVAKGPTSSDHRPSARTQAAWLGVSITKRENLPIGKEGLALVAHQGRLYSVGGYTGAYSTTSIFQMFPTVRQVATLPQPSHDNAAGFIGGDLFVFGGGQATSYSTVVRVHRNQAQTIAQLARPLSDATAVDWTENGQQGVLVIGGYDDAVFNRDARFYTTTTTTTTTGSLHSRVLFQLPVGVRYAGTATSGNMVVIAGGLSAAGPVDTVYTWSPTTGIHLVAHLPVALQKAATFVWQSHIIVAGGFQSDGSPSTAIWDVRLADHRVRQIGQLPLPLADMGYAQIGSNGYVLGGATTGGGMNRGLYQLSIHAAHK